MLHSITSRIPAGIAHAIHQAVYLGTTYACLSLLAAWVGALLDFAPSLRAPR